MSATWNISVLTSASSDTEPALLVNFGTSKYIFNASEAMGRSWLQSHQSFRKMKGMFLTGVGTHRCGGIAGTCVLPCSCVRANVKGCLRLHVRRAMPQHRHVL